VGGRPASVNRERGNIPLVCRIEGDGERLLWEKRKNQKGLFGFFFGWAVGEGRKMSAGLGGSCRNGGRSPCKQRVAAFCVVFV